MRIRQIEIIGFGKWIDQSFQVSPSLQVFYGKNESGKSTLVSFIQSIFFGFPTRQSNDSRYEPEKSSQYGGRLHIEESKYGDVILERIPQNKVTGEGKIIIDDHTTLNDQAFPDFFSQINHNLYRQIYLFTLSDLEKIRNLKAQELEANFLNLSVSGASDYLNLAEKFEKQASDLYKPSGRKPALNQAIQSLHEADHQLSLAEGQNADYIKLQDKQSHIEEELNQLNLTLKRTKEEADILSYLLQHWDKVERYQFLNQSIQQHRQLVTEDDRQKFHDLFAESQELTYQIDQLTSELKDLQAGRLDNPEDVNTYIVQKEHYDSVFEKLPSMNKSIARYEEAQQSLEEKRNAQELLASQLAIEDEEELEKITVADERRLADWQKTIEETKSQLNHIDKELYRLDYQLNQNESDRRSSTSPTSLVSLMSLGVFVLTVVLLSLIDVQFSLSAIGGILTGLATYFLVQSKSSKNSNASSEESMLSKEQSQFEKDRRQLNQKMNQVNEHYQFFLKEKGLSQSIDLDSLIKQAAFYNQFVDQREVINKLAEDQKQVYKQIEEQAKLIDQYVDEFKVNPDPLLKIYRLQAFKDRVEQALQADTDLSQDIGVASKAIADKHRQADLVDGKLNNLMSNYNVDSLVSFKKMITESEQIDRQLAELKTLEDFFSYYTDKHSDIMIEQLRYDKLESDLRHKQSVINQAEQRKDSLVEEKSALKVEMNQLEEGSQYSQNLQIYENQKSKVNQLIEEYLSLKLAADLIKETIKSGIQDQLPQIIQTASHYFSRLTHQRYSGIRLKDNQIQVQRQDASIFDVKALSRGTAEPLYSALRLAMIYHRSNKIKLPILVDDSFVNLDPSRKAVIYDILEEMSHQTQVIIFTFDSDVIERYPMNQVTHL